MAFQSYREYRAPRWEDFPDIELYMDQVISVLERYLSLFAPEGEKAITSTMINNYVKQKLIAPPANKRYGRSQLVFLFVICILKKFMQLSRIKMLLENLRKDKSDEEAYAFFAAQLDDALRLVFERKIPDHTELEDPAENCVRSAVVAFAVIVYSEAVFAEAEKGWKAALESELAAKEKAEEEERRKKEQEKNEKKEKKKNTKEEK